MMLLYINTSEKERERLWLYLRGFQNVSVSMTTLSQAPGRCLTELTDMIAITCPQWHGAIRLMPVDHPCWSAPHCELSKTSAEEAARPSRERDGSDITTEYIYGKHFYFISPVWPGVGHLLPSCRYLRPGASLMRAHTPGGCFHSDLNSDIWVEMCRFFNFLTVTMT